MFLKAFKAIKKSKKTTLPNKRFVIDLHLPKREGGLLKPIIKYSIDPWCNGSTPVFGIVSQGSNPCGSTKEGNNPL